MPERVKPGRLRVSQRGLNRALAAGEQLANEQTFLGAEQQITAVTPAIIKVKNLTGGTRRQGDVVAFDQSVTTEHDGRSAFFASHLNAVTFGWDSRQFTTDVAPPVASSPSFPVGVLLDPVIANGYARCVVSGRCLAYVNNPSGSNWTHGRATNGAYSFTASHGGESRLLARGSGWTGERLVSVCLAPEWLPKHFSAGSSIQGLYALSSGKLEFGGASVGTATAYGDLFRFDDKYTARVVAPVNAQPFQVTWSAYIQVSGTSEPLWLTVELQVNGSRTSVWEERTTWMVTDPVSGPLTIYRSGTAVRVASNVSREKLSTNDVLSILVTHTPSGPTIVGSACMVVQPLFRA